MYSINSLLQLLGDFVPKHHGTIISMSRRVLATLGRLYKRIFKKLMTLNPGFKYHLYDKICSFIHKYVYLYTLGFAAANQYEPC